MNTIEKYDLKSAQVELTDDDEIHLIGKYNVRALIGLLMKCKENEIYLYRANVDTTDGNKRPDEAVLNCLMVSSENKNLMLAPYWDKKE